MNTPQIQRMIDACKSKLKNCYNPYSKFSVVSSLLMDGEDKIYSGCNIENASYGLTMCAERVAIYNAVSNSESNTINCILIHSPTDDFIYPCGACRQVINEFSNEKSKVIVSNKDGHNIIYHIHELLPNGFGPKNLISSSHAEEEYDTFILEKPRDDGNGNFRTTLKVKRGMSVPEDQKIYVIGMV